MDDAHTAPRPHPSTAHAPGGRGGGRGGRRGVVVAGVAIVVLALVAGLIWLFTAGPLSPRARAEDEVRDAVRGLGSVGSFAEFNERMCEQNRLPRELVDSISASGRATGQDVDTVFREQALSRFPGDLEIPEVTVDGDDATAVLRSPGKSTDETVHLRREGDRWTVCEQGVGLGAVPPGGR